MRDLLLNFTELSDNQYYTDLSLEMQSYQVKVETEQRYVKMLMNYEYFYH